MISDQEVFDYFVQRIKEELFTHPVITNNSYCKWFADATLTKSDIIYFTKQFNIRHWDRNSNFHLNLHQIMFLHPNLTIFGATATQ